MITIREQLLKEFESQNRNGIYSFIQKMMAYNSNKIEGSTLTSEQTASLFDTGSFYASEDSVYRAKDVEEMNGHFKMFNYMLKSIEEPLTERLIKKLHYELKSGVFEDKVNGYPVGEYKTRENFVSDIRTAKCSEVAKEMSGLLNDYNHIKNISLDNIMKFHALFENIHPFQDGNGRVGRMLILRECLVNDIMPVIIRDSEKMIYYHCLHKAQVEEEYQPLIQFAKEQQTFFEATFQI